MKLHTLALYPLALLLCSCAATSVKTTSKSPDTRGPTGKIAVVAVEQRGLVREGFENRLVNQLIKNGASAMTTFNQLSLVQIKEDRRAAVERFRASGAEAVLILRLSEKTGSYSETRLGVERYAPGTSGYDAVGWYDYYSGGFLRMNVSYGTVREKAFLEFGLYDLKTEKPIWSAVTQTAISENMDKVAEMDPLVKTIVEAMRKDGVIP